MPSKEKKQKPLSLRVFNWVVIFFVVYTFLGFLVIPAILKPVLTKKLSEELNRKVTIKDIDLNPYALSLNVSGFAINNLEDSEVFLSFKNLYLNLQSSSVFKKGLILRDVRLDKPYIKIVRTEDNIYNFSDLVKESPPDNEPATKPFRFSINNIQILDGRGVFRDFPKDTRHEVKDITIKIPMISNFQYYLDTFMQPVFRATVNGMPIHVEGKTKPFHDSLETAFEVDLKDFRIPHYLGYIPFKVNFDIPSGSIDLESTVIFTQYSDRPPTLILNGDIGLKKFEMIDKDNNPLISLPSLDISVESSELISKELHFSKISLRSPEVHLMIDKEGKLNFQSLMPEAGKEVKDSKAEEASQAFKVNIDEVLIEGGKVLFSDSLKRSVKIEVKRFDIKGGEVLQESGAQQTIKVNSVKLEGGEINFSDKYIKPNYAVNLNGIKVSLSGLSTDDETLADFTLQGNLENYAPLKISGRINPLKEDIFIDLKIDFKDMDLSPLTPYAGTYMGYAIQKGKLVLDLKYDVDENELKASNSILFDQFTLGSKVESPKATKLPVSLAVALLRDVNGRINLDLPITGRIDDPEFHLGSVIIKVLMNILIKAATSPFALLGSIVGGGEELSYIEFNSGSSDIDKQGEEKLAKLIEALKSRPSLKLEIEGYADKEKDTEALRQYIFSRKLKVQKLESMSRRSQGEMTEDEVVIDPDEYEKILWKAYKKEKFKKQKNAFGFTKKIPVPEMEKLMLEHIAVGDDDLRLLALKRAQDIKGYMLKSGQVDQNNIFLVEPEQLQPDKKDEVKQSRVDFKLK